MREEGYPFSFDPSACEACGGRCCIGESGNIWISPDEITAFAEHLNLTRDEFVTQYLSKIGYRYSIKEIEYKDGYRCVFFDTDKNSAVHIK